MTAESAPAARLRLGEFVAMAALLISLVALSTDAMLPVLPEMGRDLRALRPNDPQLILSALFLGLAGGQIVYGPLSDSIGRKPAIYLGSAIFICGCVLSVVATSMPMMLAGRLLQGFGAAGPRTVIIALVRDQYAGRGMARIMSFVMAVFILVPVIAPAIGQGIVFVSHWRAIFGLFLVLALIGLAWFAVRQPETLPAERRVRFSLGNVAAGVAETCTNRTSLGYMIAGGLILGAFGGYLLSAQQILQEQYRLGALFPFYFGALAVAIGAASIVNARLVMCFGMRALSSRALAALCACSGVFFAIAFATAGQPPLWALMVYLLIAFFCFGLLFGTFNALAMEPIGHIAGVGSATIGTVTTFMFFATGTLIGQAYDGTVLPLIGGFAVLGAASLAVMGWTERGRRD